MVAIVTPLLLRLDPTLSDLYYGTFLGGAREDYGLSIEIHFADQAIVAGLTYSADYPTTPQAFNRRPNDIFVTRLEPDGKRFGSLVRFLAEAEMIL